jgi:methanol---5-hydroxybenzimidazolylcobamide Co-methyltransferase
MGILAAAGCETWSNESVQNVKLLGGMAPTCYLEQLACDCRLMTARSHGKDSAQQLALSDRPKFLPEEYGG